MSEIPGLPHHCSPISCAAEKTYDDFKAVANAGQARMSFADIIDDIKDARGKLNTEDFDAYRNLVNYNISQDKSFPSINLVENIGDGQLELVSGSDTLCFNGQKFETGAAGIMRFDRDGSINAVIDKNGGWSHVAAEACAKETEKH
jgi:hypothetical protein